jgi:hypothetical protein
MQQISSVGIPINARDVQKGYVLKVKGHPMIVAQEPYTVPVVGSIVLQLCYQDKPGGCSVLVHPGDRVV